jgi:hypothetical protein
MWKRLRKLVGGDARAEAEAAGLTAESSLKQAETQAVHAQRVTGRILEHGRRNHFGERIEAAWRRA